MSRPELPATPDFYASASTVKSLLDVDRQITELKISAQVNALRRNAEEDAVRAQWIADNVHPRGAEDLTSSPPPTDPALRTRQLAHQAPVFLDHRDDPCFALFWEMGLGKAKTMMDVAAHQCLTGRIQAILVIAPKSVYQNWHLAESPVHWTRAVPHLPFAYHTEGSRRDESEVMRDLVAQPSEFRGLTRFVTMSYDSLGTERGLDLAMRIVKNFPTLVALDESQAIGRGSTLRARLCMDVGRGAVARWIMSGTPAASSPFALHSQIKFLDPGFWVRHGMRTYEAFRNEFGIYRVERVGRRMFSRLASYRNLERLSQLIAPICSRLLKDDSGVSLPAKTYVTRYFDMAPRQRELYDRVRRQFTAQLDAEMSGAPDMTGGRVDAALAIVRVGRLHQIACGYVTASVLRPVPDPGQTEEDLDDEVGDVEDGSITYVEEEEEEGAPALWPAPTDEPAYVRGLDEYLPHTRPSATYAMTSDSLARHVAVSATERQLGPDGEEPILDQEHEQDEILRELRSRVRMLQPQLMMRENRLVDVVPTEQNPRLQLLMSIIEEAQAGLPIASSSASGAPGTPDEGDDQPTASTPGDDSSNAHDDATRLLADAVLEGGESGAASAQVLGDLLEERGDVAAAGRVRGKIIVWCKFRKDVENVCAALGPDRCVRYDGTVRRRDREEALRRFRDPSDHRARVLVANLACLSEGVTLTVATVMIYYSQGFRLGVRLQSEDRFHRIGQRYPVLIVDLAATNSVDDRIISTLKKKFELAATCTGDKLREWLT